MCASQASPVVLLVEDEMFVRMTTLDMLEEMSCTVIEAAAGAEALTRLQEAGRVDLLISDVGLPDINGQDLYAACLKLCPGLPVIFITGYGSADLSATLDGAPLASVLAKPFRMRELREAVQAALAAGRRAQS